MHNPQTVRPVARSPETVRPDVVHAHNLQNGLSFDMLACDQLARPAGRVHRARHQHDHSRCAGPLRSTRLRARFAEPDYRLPPLHNARLLRLRYNPFHNRVIRGQLARFTRVRTCVSEAQRRALEANGIPPLTVVYNGVDPSSTRSDRRHGRGGPGAEAPPRRSESRAVRRAIHRSEGQCGVAPGVLPGRRPGARGSPPDPDIESVLGRTSTSTRAIRACATSTPSTCTSPAGWTHDELAAAYQIADVVTVPSICLEPAGMVAIEAMLAGRPVVATCFGGRARARHRRRVRVHRQSAADRDVRGSPRSAGHRRRAAASRWARPAAAARSSTSPSTRTSSGRCRATSAPWPRADDGRSAHSREAERLSIERALSLRASSARRIPASARRG